MSFYDRFKKSINRCIVSEILVAHFGNSAPFVRILEPVLVSMATNAATDYERKPFVPAGAVHRARGLLLQNTSLFKTFTLNDLTDLFFEQIDFRRCFSPLELARSGDLFRESKLGKRYYDHGAKPLFRRRQLSGRVGCGWGRDHCSRGYGNVEQYADSL